MRAVPNTVIEASMYVLYWRVHRHEQDDIIIAKDTTTTINEGRKESKNGSLDARGVTNKK